VHAPRVATPFELNKPDETITVHCAIVPDRSFVEETNTPDHLGPVDSKTGFLA